MLTATHNAAVSTTLRSVPKPNPPAALWVGVGAMLVLCVTQLVVAFAALDAVLAMASVVGMMLAAGLAYRHRWAYTLTLAFCALGLVAPLYMHAMGPALAVTLVNALVFVPVLLTTGWFFGPRDATA